MRNVCLEVRGANFFFLADWKGVCLKSGVSREGLFFVLLGCMRNFLLTSEESGRRIPLDIEEGVCV